MSIRRAVSIVKTPKPVLCSSQDGVPLNLTNTLVVNHYHRSSMHTFDTC
jgi:hypothetical protein